MTGSNDGEEASSPPPPEPEPSRDAVWAGDEYEVVVRERTGKVTVKVEPLGMLTYCGPGPYWWRIDPRPPVWWKPWTWFRGPAAISRAIERAVEKAKEKEMRDKRGRVAGKKIRGAVTKALERDGSAG